VAGTGNRGAWHSCVLVVVAKFGACIQLTLPANENGLRMEAISEPSN
jgi:hypothetical protein